MSRILVRGTNAGTVREVAGASTAAAVHTVRCQQRAGMVGCRLARARRLGSVRGVNERLRGRISSVRVHVCIARCKFMVLCVK